MKFIAIFDPHVCDVPPSSRKDNYRDNVLKKIQFAVNFANREKVEAILILGDLFHRKIPSHNSHELIRDLISVLNSSKVPVFAIAGNHDISGTLQNLYRQPISVLETAGCLKLLNNDEPVVFSEGDFKVSLNGRAYDQKLDCKEAGELYSLNHAKDSNFNISLFHQMILPDGQTFFNDYINFEDLAEINANLIIDGHYHVGFNPSMVKYNDKKYFMNGGSLSRGTSEEFNLNKVPSFCFFEVKEYLGEVFVENRDVEVPYLPADEVFDMKMVKQRKEKLLVKDFINNLSEFEATSLQSETPDGIIQILKAMGAKKNILDLAEGYLNKSYEGMKV